jgi:Fe2+ transport system protein B
MDKFFLAIKDGTIKGLQTGLFLLKIMIPVYLVVVLIKYSPVMPWLERIFTPAMKVFNLPADGVVPIIAGVFTDEYGVIAAMSGFDFTTAGITTIAMISLTFHSIPVESAIAQKIGFPALPFGIFRLFSAILIGILVGWLGGVFL